MENSPIAQKGQYEVEIQTNSGAVLKADLTIPANVKGAVLFAHGSGSSRFSSRNRFVAEQLQRASFATLLLDLLTHEEELLDRVTAKYRFDIEFLTQRLLAATDWLKNNTTLADHYWGYFGASTGAAAALKASVERPNEIKAVVSRGGRTDLANDSMPRVKAATLFIVGQLDWEVKKLNHKSMILLHCEKAIEVVPKAGHLFEEPGALEEVALLAADWFKNYLKG
ncbi:MAG TPA: dienelactone hydrolase family protein [Candidatus Omnitrophota bacterium]|nr:dienelactone hydrolase family protein [Candidatus Omnitrophota bacterium]